MGDQYLAKVDAMDGVYKTPSGLRFSILAKPANAAAVKSPNEADSCKVHYTGTLIDGTVFDSSVNRGAPAMFAPQQVIAGWKEALQYMAEGEKWRVYLPHNLAYGEKGAGGVIPPRAVLTFTIEVIQVVSGGKPGTEGHNKLEQALGNGVTYNSLKVVK